MDGPSNHNPTSVTFFPNSSAKRPAVLSSNAVEMVYPRVQGDPIELGGEAGIKVAGIYAKKRKGIACIHMYYVYYI